MVRVLFLAGIVLAFAVEGVLSAPVPSNMDDVRYDCTVSNLPGYTYRSDPSDNLVRRARGQDAGAGPSHGAGPSQGAQDVHEK